MIGGLLALIVGRTAAAQDLKDRVNFRISLSSLYLREDQPGETDPAAPPPILSDPPAYRRLNGPTSIAWGDLRTVLDARRLPGNFELHLDGRVRLTGGVISQGGTDFNGNGPSFDPATGTMPAQLTASSKVVSRGYLGGREYQISELYARGRWSKIDLGLGRLVIGEADALRLDGARLWIHAHKHWDVSLYGGTYPDPYSRSIDTDYVAGSTPGSGIAIVGGANARYGYDRIYGSFSINAAYLGGNDDGGALDPTPDPATSMPGDPRPRPASYSTEKIRSWLTWSNFWRPIKYIDVYHDLVVDLASAAGFQLTRLDLLVSAHLNKYVTLRAGYDHMSSVAIEMYLSRLLANRTEFLPGVIDNNLTVSRIARDEARLAIEGQFGLTMVTLEGRYRHRVLATPSNDPQFLTTAATGTGGQVAPSAGYDATLSVRNRGSLWGLRPSVWLTYLRDYRARNVYVGLGIGRDFWHERVTFDFGLTYANTRDEQADNAFACQPGPLLQPTPADVALGGCFGTRKGHNVQPGLTLSLIPARHWFLFVDYRAGIAISEGLNYILTNVLLARVEARF